MRGELKALATVRLQERGTPGLTLRELGAAVGIKSPSVLHHFGSKEALVAEVTQDYANAFRARLAQLEGKHRSPRKRLEGLVDLFAEPLREGRHCLCGMLGTEVSQLGTETHRVLNTFFADVLAWAESQLIEVQGIAAVQAGVYARVLVAGLEGALMIDRVASGERHLEALRQWVVSLGKGS